MLLFAGLKPKPKVDTTENESMYSGHSSSSLKKEPPRLNNATARVKRTGSSATSVSRTSAPPASRRKMPGSVTSSINSSESEPGSVPQSSRSNRSVYLHATAVAEIPASHPKNPPPDQAAGGPASNLKNSKKISRSISLLAPFKPKQTRGGVPEVNYDSSGNQVPYAGGKPPRPPPARRQPPPAAAMSKDKKFASSSDLLRGDENEVANQPTAVQESPKASSKVSRSVSMPKDTRLAGWFKKRKRV